MITNAAQAFDLTQKFNQEMWRKDAMYKLMLKIETAANNGLGFINVDFKSLIIGAEDVHEAGIMLITIGEDLDNRGFKHNITKDGNLYISWK